MQVFSIKTTSYTPLKTHYKNKCVSFGKSIDEHLSQGARYQGNEETIFRVDAPMAKRIRVEIVKNNNYSRIESFPLTKEGNSTLFSAKLNAKPGDKYRYLIDSKSSMTFATFDPRADYLPDDVSSFKENSGWSEIIDHKFDWTDSAWMSGVDTRRISSIKEGGWQLPSDTVIRVTHVGILGGFEKAKKDIDRVANDKIANVIRLMPITEFYGHRGWGYDSVAMFAPENGYGKPDELKDFIDYAHSRGVNVILDVVPSHFGAFGNPYDKMENVYRNDVPKEYAWESPMWFEGEKGRYLRSLFHDMLVHWAVNYHVDGFRFDAMQKMYSDNAIKEIMYDLRNHDETKNLIFYPEHLTISKAAANSNLRKFVNDDNFGFDAQINFDFFKALIFNITNEPVANQKFTLENLKEVFERGVIKYNQRDNLPTPGSGNNIINVSNHDEIGNGSGGRRNIIQFMYQKLGMHSRCDGNWKQASWLMFDLVKNYAIYNDVIPLDIQRKYGCVNPVTREDFERVLKDSFELNKLAWGAMFLHPSPKAFMMGDEWGELAPFKYFCDMLDYAFDSNGVHYMQITDNEKGYPVDESAFIESKMNRKEYTIEYVSSGMENFVRDLAKLMREKNAMKNGSFERTSVRCINDGVLEVVRTGDDGSQIIGIMNFTQNTCKNIFVGPSMHKLKVLLNSHDCKYSGNIDCSSTIINDSNNITIEPNSFIIYEPVYQTQQNNQTAILF